MPDPASAADDRFFTELRELTDFHQIAERERYEHAPASWHVIITDVRGSTAAIEAGRYKDVNALGVASIVALRNALPDVELPYVFGGDGATMLVPGSRLEACDRALRGVRRIARSTFDLDLRAARVSVADLRAAGHGVRVARYRASAHVRLAMFSGSGFAEAERRIKASTGGAHAISDEGSGEVSLEGFECRWQPVESRRGHVVSLLVLSSSSSDEESSRIYREVLSKVEELTETGVAPPLAAESLQMAGPALSNYEVEARIRTGERAGPLHDAHRRRARVQTLVGRALTGLRLKHWGFDGRSYKRELLENTDFRKFDETLRMVLDLTDGEFEALHAYLEAEHGKGRLVFGTHRSKHALVTCYVRSYSGDHVHFVDGANGGYALAAKALKARAHRRAPAEG